ncbi:hypothetical protein [Novosphingobium olei]|uniref:Uncharacterized protein n=1 Tax=Novosphingobium olei TaxID=2728851 RepID=A0A7Y0BPL8_9SPHN|nr:hypothetical protein [Novosphingobium olei]NML93601.1 hypothetical protein [Novosphingobium olei]
MRMTVRHRWRWVILAAALLAVACGGVFGKTYPAYRYRVTVEVETPQGLRRGSSVIEVQTTAGGPYSISGGGGGGIATRVTGEAAAIDLPNGETLFALLRTHGSPELPENLYALQIPYPTKAEVEARTGKGKWSSSTAFDIWMERVRTSRGIFTVPRWRTDALAGASGWPMLVRFGDTGDPGSVEEINPNDLRSTFGRGYAIKRVLVGKTNDPIAFKLEARLPWLPHTKGSLVEQPRRADGSLVPLGEAGLAVILNYRAFRRDDK